MSRAARRGEAGLTLIELMIAVAIASIAMGTALAVAYTMASQFKDHREISTTERAARVSLDIMADAVRAASPGVLQGTVQDAVSCGPAEAFRVTNAASMLTFDGVTVVDDTDVLEVVYASGGVKTSLYEDYAPGDGTLTVFDGEWVEGDYAVLTNVSPLDSQGVVFRITGAPSGAFPSITLPISPCAAFTAGFVKGNLVIRARLARFFVGNPEFPSLYMDLDGPGGDYTPEPIAPGVEDMQIAVGVDADANGEVTLAEWHYDAAGDPAPPPLGNAASPWRALRIGLSARSLTTSSDQASFFRPALEDHAQSANDAYRRRVLQTTVDIRNLGGSP